ncbi:MHCK/EF2 kinase, partial [Mycena metata]
LMMELRCLAWGRVLMELVYLFIENFLTKRQLEKAPFPIPRFQFVDVALLISQNEFYLVETPIHGEFRKYINNRAAVPLDFLDARDTNSAEFLCFAQHIQYQETFKTLFVSDFQGNDRFLTDPQILTSGEGKQLFADGNVSKGFLNFETDHRCNAFCKFFEL